MIQIYNDILTASIQAKGAEITSLQKDRKEYIWQAEPSVWARHSPILFPIVAKLINNQYTHNDKTYHLNQHGFARDCTFTLESKEKSSVCFLLQSNEDTKAMYPFDFELRVTHFLKENRLKTKYEVTNTSKETMYFSIGGHPAFCCPIEEGHERQEYALRMDDAVDVKSKLLDKGTISHTKEKDVLIDQQYVPLGKETFQEDALIFDPNPFRKATLVHLPTEKEYLAVHFQGFASLGVWSKNEVSPFVCIEPWYGTADYEGHDGELRNKKGILSLEKGATFSCQYAVAVF